MGLLDWIKQLFSNNKKNARIYATTFNKTYGEGDPLEVGLYEGTTPLANKKIIININGVDYERVTDENGIAKLNINLKVGEYKTLLTFNENEIYNQTTAYVKVYVNPKITTSDLIMDYKDGSKFIATLKDINDKPINNSNVIFNINGVDYTRTTNEQGQASLNINLTPNTYIIQTKVNDIVQKNTIIINEAKPQNTKHFGYWIFGRDMYNVDLNHLKEKGVTDIFLNYYAIESHGKDKVIEWIRQAKPINIHLWMQCFYDGEWHNPKDMDLSGKIQEAKSYAEIEGVAGVHLDYLRYPGNAYKTNGGTEAVTNFTRQVREVVPKNIMLSCAVMPENENEYYYGQNISELGKIVDFITPMQYKGNYEAGTSWLASTTKNFSQKAVIWSGLQSYKSDDDTSVLSQNEIENDIKTCLDNGAQGALLFRYGLSADANFAQFNSQAIPSSKINTRMEGTNVEMNYQDGSKYQCAVYDNNGRIAVPVDIIINGVTYTKTPDAEGLYKLNLNLLPGQYNIRAVFKGNDIYNGSSITNTIKINEAPKEVPKSEPVQLYDYFTQQGGGYLGQRTGYTCGPHSLMQCIHRLTGEDVSEMQLASVAGTTTDGTDHDGLATALAWFNKQYGYNLKMTWKNFSEVGFEGTQQLIDNGACFHHILYRDEYGHYEVPKWTNGDPIYVLNSLGDNCGDGYCGYIEERSRSTHQSYINGISQKSVCIITRE